MKKKICAILAISCAITILGAIGSEEVGRLSLSETIKICAVALPIFLITFKNALGGYYNE